MPAMKCPSCGHRHFQQVEECLNCGEPLAAPDHLQLPDEDAPVGGASSPYSDNDETEEVPMVEPSSPYSDNDETAGYERSLSESRRKSTGLKISTEMSPEGFFPDPSTYTRDTEPSIPAVQRPGLAAHTPPQDAQAGGDASSRQLVRQPGDHLESNQVWRKRHEIQPYEIYETALDIVPPEAFSSPPGRIEQEQQVDPELWKTDKLPWYFPRTKPKIAGKVILIETKEEIIDYPDLFAAIATLLVEFIWILVQVQQEKEHDRIVMTTVRVRTYDGTLRDSRLRGVMRGANVSLGDQVSLWGMRRNGVLFVSRGFNHTTRGVISTHSMGLIVPALIVIVAFIVSIYFAPYWLSSAVHHLIDLFGAFLNFTRTHHLTIPIQKKR
jgi:hypothetical protein